MGDIRFVMIGIGLVFAGFVTFGVLGDQYQSITIQSGEFDACYEYAKDSEPIRVSCADKMDEQMLFFAAVAAFIGAGSASLIKGARGNWDNKVRPEEMVGPKKTDSEEEEKELHRHGADAHNENPHKSNKDNDGSADHNTTGDKKDREDADSNNASKKRDDKRNENPDFDHGT